MQLSPVQDHIISLLKNAKTLRYRDMRARDTPNDLYNYHLKHLINKGMVTKVKEGYTLSSAGLKYVADVYHTSDSANRLFKLNVITLVSRLIDGQTMILNQVRGSNPSFGKVGAMGGTVIKGEPLEVAAARKLKQETGLVATLKLVGWERRVAYKGEELFSDILFPITYTNTSSGEPIDTQFGHNFWTPVEIAIENEQNPQDSIQSVVTVLQAVKNKTIESLPFFFNETVQHN